MSENSSFEEAFQELEKTTERLEEGDLTLQESIALFERGMELVRYCGQLLDEADLKVKTLLPSPGDGYKLDFAIALLWTGWLFLADSLKVWEVSFTEWAIQYWPVKATLVIGPLLLTLQGVSRLVKDVIIITGKKV